MPVWANCTICTQMCLLWGQLWEDRRTVVAACVSSNEDWVTVAVVAGDLFFAETLLYLVKFVLGTRVTCSKQINRKERVLSRSR